MWVQSNGGGLIVNDGEMATLNGVGYGEVGGPMGQIRFEPGFKRPMLLRRNGRYVPHVIVPSGESVWNAKTNSYDRKLQAIPVQALHNSGLMNASLVDNATTLTKEAWIQIDQAVLKQPRLRLRFWADLVARSSVGGFNAMGKMTYEYQNMSDPGEAVVDMDGITPGRADRPLHQLLSVPLPITHSDFWFSERDIAVSRNSGAPLDMTMAEAAGRRVAETIEQTAIGTVTGLTFGTTSSGPTAHTGTSRVYGATNFPYRITKTDLHTPTSANPENVVEDVLEARESLRAAGFFGPYVVYHSTGYDRFLDDDYFRTGGTAVSRTLRERVLGIEGVSDFKRLDYLTSGYQLLVIQMTPEVVQAINGMAITTVQWDMKGGLEKHFKVMAIGVPLWRTPYTGVAGYVHGTTS